MFCVLVHTNNSSSRRSVYVVKYVGKLHVSIVTIFMAVVVSTQIGTGRMQILSRLTPQRLPVSVHDDPVII